METKWKMEWLPSGICNINPDDGHGRIATVWIRDSKINNLEEVKANARLIASAPELLEACKDIVNELGNFKNIIQYDSFIKVKQAIAKAEGK